jgi:hypothetical protein
MRVEAFKAPLQDALDVRQSQLRLDPGPEQLLPPLTNLPLSLEQRREVDFAVLVGSQRGLQAQLRLR